MKELLPRLRQVGRGIFNIMASKNKKQLNKDVGVEETPKTGCENCNNTGLEPNVARDTAQVCLVCKGSPYEPREEVK